MKTDCNELKKGNGCALDYFEKNAYFHGKLMTARDMIAEQKVQEDKLYMMNRLTLGDGIVCGLGLEDEGYEVDESGKLTVKINPGMALDCCGRILVVKEGGPITKEVTRFENGGGSGYPGTMYLYLKYRECLKEAVPISGAGDACEEKCCYNRVLEVFDVVYKDAPPGLSSLPDVNFPSKEDVDMDGNAAMLKIARDYYYQNLKDGCKECSEHIVFLGVLKKSDNKWTVNKDETKKYLSLVYNNKMLYDVLANHVTRFDNPHEVTAKQAGAIVSVDGVSNPGGDIGLKKKNAIVIEADDANNTITIGETHSAKKDNPHDVTAKQAGAIVSVDGVGNPGGDINLVEGKNIKIFPKDDKNEIEISAPISIKEVEPDTEGNIDLVAGKNIEITPNKGGHAIAISCKSRDAAPVHTGYCVFKDVGPGEIRISKPISHGLELGDVGMVLADELENQILIGDREHFADVEDFSVSPALAAKVEPGNKTLMIFLKNLDERERTFVVRWWAIQAAKDLGRCEGESLPPEEIDTGVFDRSSFDQAKFEKSQQPPTDEFNTAKFSRSVFS